MSRCIPGKANTDRILRLQWVCCAQGIRTRLLGLEWDASKGWQQDTIWKNEPRIQFCGDLKPLVKSLDFRPAGCRISLQCITGVLGRNSCKLAAGCVVLDIKNGSHCEWAPKSAGGLQET